ncbi:hypothetical protein Tco_0545612 [Tanacetum coccineum]
MSSPHKPLPKPSRVAKMSIRPIWRKKLNHCNSSNEVNVYLPTPKPKPQSPLNEPSQENIPTTHSNHVSLQSHSPPLSDSSDTNCWPASIPPQSINQTQLTQPSFPHLLSNPHVANVLHAQTPPSPQGDNHTQPLLPPSPIGFCGGEEDEKELVEMGEVGGGPFGGGEGEDLLEDDMMIVRKSGRFEEYDVIEREKNDVHI